MAPKYFSNVILFPVLVVVKESGLPWVPTREWTVTTIAFNAIPPMDFSGHCAF